MMKLQPFLLRPQPKHVHNHAQRVAQIELPRFNGEAAGLDFGQIQQIVDEMQQMVAAALNDFQPGPLLICQTAVALQHLRIAENPVERGAKFMAHVRQEFAFRPVRGFGGNRRLLQFLRALRDKLFEMLFIRFQFVFDQFPRRDIRMRPDHAHDLAVGVALHDFSAPEYPSPFAAPRFHAKFRRKNRRQILEMLFQRVFGAAEVVGMYALAPTRARCRKRPRRIV